MERLINAIQTSLKNKNWYGALFISLSLPDICGSLENPLLQTREKYVAWFNKYLASEYTRSIGPFGKHTVIFLSAEDCYALRCAYLHKGCDEILDQRCRQVLSNFRFTTDQSHRNRIGTTLQLNVELFCKEICTGVEQWLRDVAPHQDVQNRISQMSIIHDSIFTVDNAGAHIP